MITRPSVVHERYRPLDLFNAIFGTILVMIAVDPNPVLILANCSSHYFVQDFLIVNNFPQLFHQQSWTIF